jgi:AraC-like DNA-binding protein
LAVQLTISANFIRAQEAAMIQRQPEDAQTLATLWQVITRLLELHGVNSSKLLLAAGVRPQALRDESARIPANLDDAVFEAAMQQIKDPAWALRAAECWHPSNLGVMGYAWLSSRTLHTGLKRMERYSRLIGTDFTYTVSERMDGLHFEHDPCRSGNARLGWVYADFTLSVIMDMCRRNRGEHLQAKYVMLRRPQPQDAHAWTSFFGCEVRFQSRVNAIVLRLEDANAPLPTANIQLAQAFDEMLGQQMLAMDGDDLVSRTKSLIARELTSGTPSAGWVASELALSERSLLRKLDEHGTSFRALLDLTRFELASRYLVHSQKSATEIAFLVGLSESSAFTRAFRRWAGVTPSQFRSVQAGQPLAG